MLQWIGVTAGAFCLIVGWPVAAAASFVIALFAYLNTRSLERFIEAQSRPPFRIKEFR
jgi:hypothetical protein